MSEELSGRELTRAAYLAAGVEIKLLRDSSTKVAVWPDGTLLSYGESTEEKLWRRVPDAASSIAAAWPLLEKWRRKNKHREAVLILKENKTATCIVWGESDWGFEGEADAEKSDESAMATAICRALVAAAQVKDVKP